MNNRKRGRLPSIACPHCANRLIVRSSEQVTSLVRELRLVCDNADCGASFVAQLSLDRAIRPSLTPNPDVRLPVGNWRHPANDDRQPAERPAPANDDAPPAAATIVPS